MTTVDYPAGSLVNARGRDWLVLPGSPEGTLLVRPLGGREHETTVLLPEIDDFAAATFEPPTRRRPRGRRPGPAASRRARLSFRASGGPFRSFARLAVAPRNYQLVPLMMARRPGHHPAADRRRRRYRQDGRGGTHRRRAAGHRGRAAAGGVVLARSWPRNGRASCDTSSASTRNCCCRPRSTG